MKEGLALLFVSTMLTFAACQSKPKLEETTTDSTSTTMSTDTTTMVDGDSASTMLADSAK